MKNSQYKTNWESYWSKLFEDNDTAMWDTTSDLAIANALPRIKQAFEPSLPLIDFGCGNGTQAFFLAQHFDSAIGVDVSDAAIKQARSNNSHENLSLEVLDGTNRDDVLAFHSRIGDANIYMRGILHQISPKDRPTVIESLQILMGNTGKLYLNELSPKAKASFEDLVRQTGSLPPQLARVYQHGIEPASVNQEEISVNFSNDKYSVVDEGETLITTNYILPDGNCLQLPGFYMLIESTYSRSN